MKELKQTELNQYHYHTAEIRTPVDCVLISTGYSYTTVKYSSKICTWSIQMNSSEEPQKLKNQPATKC